VLVFSNDILIYSPSWAKHLQHVSLVFDALCPHGLYLKRSKCSFRALSVTYLSHVISTNGIAMDNDKVDAVSSWLEPRSPWGTCSFLGLGGYYRKFIQDFGTIAAPLMWLLHKEAFEWMLEAADAFAALKCALSLGPVLQMSDFDR
jgi:hypothetical protein